MPRKPKTEQIEHNPSKIVNCYECIPSDFLDKKLSNPNRQYHNFDIPFRACVVAPSGSGKTNFVTNLIRIFCMGAGTFSNITIICKDSSEPLYKFLASRSDSIQVKEGLHNLPQLDKADKENSTLVIIDDCQLDKDQTRVCEYYIRCRKKSVSIIYLAQNYYQIPKVIRNNCNYLIILKISGDRDLRMILKENSVGIQNKDQLIKMYQYATQEKFSPLIIDIESSDINHKYRKGLTEYLEPANFI